MNQSFRNVYKRKTKIKETKEAGSILTNEKIMMNELFTLVILSKELEINEKTIEKDIEEVKRAGKIRLVGPKRLILFP